jgi:hypothetical protein
VPVKVLVERLTEELALALAAEKQCPDTKTAVTANPV